MKNNEIWKDIPGYEGLYKVSNQGRVKSLNYNRTGKEGILKPSMSNGYPMIVLPKNKKICVHRLVAMAFLGHKPDGHKLVIDHINSNRSDNRIENLRIITQRENSNKEVFSKKGLPRGINKIKNSYVVRIGTKKSRKYLGSFLNLEDAISIYQKALLEITQNSPATS